MGAWKGQPQGWPWDVPAPDDTAFAGRAGAWLAAEAVPAWMGLSVSTLHDVPYAAARLGWRYRRAELEEHVRQTRELRRDLRQAGLAPPVVDEVVRAALGRGRHLERTLEGLAALGEHLRDR